MYTFGKKRFFRKPEVDCKCGHPHVTHYTKEGNCVYEKCECLLFSPKGKQEFQNKRARCEYNHSHDSGLEVKTCFDLHCLLLANEIKSYTGHETLQLTGPSGAVIATYEIDFVVHHLDGSVEYVECKGAHLQHEGQWPLKWKLLQDKHKGDKMVKLRLVIG